MVTYPEDWAKYPFGQFFKLLPNNTLSRDKLSEYGEIGNIHYGDVLIKYGDEISDKDDIPRIKEEIGYVPKNLLEKGDVILADTAEDETVGKVSEIGDISIPLVGGLHTVVCRPMVATTDGYLGVYMNSKYYHDQLLPYITGIKVSSISKKSLNNTEIIIPSSVREQYEIVKVFRCMDDHIANLTELIEKKKWIREGALEDLMSGRSRLEEFSDDFIEIKLRDVTDILNGDRGVNYPSKEEFRQYGVPFINAGHLKNGRVMKENMDFISVDRFNSLGGGKIVRGDILFCLRGSLGKYAVVDFDNGAPASSLCIIRAKDTLISKKFLYYLLGCNSTREQIETSNNGTSQPNLSANDVGKFIYQIPATYNEQEKIANVIEDMDEEISALETEKEKMIQIREGAMDDLLTGRVRLPVEGE